MRKIRILIACEESQRVCIAFRKRGFEAFSCDILPCSGGYPEWHMQGDVLEHLNDGWDAIIAHPPCTRLTNSGVRWLAERNLWKELDEAAAFFNAFLNAPVEFVAVENPIMHKHALQRIGKKHTQCVQPYMFGHAESKATCFWLKNLPPLKETNNVKSEWQRLPKKEAQRLHYLSPGKERAMLRSKTFEGIAEAMAQQWGDYIQRQIEAKASGVETLRTPPTSEEVGIRAGDLL